MKKEIEFNRNSQINCIRNMHKMTQFSVPNNEHALQ